MTEALLANPGDTTSDVHDEFLRIAQESLGAAEGNECIGVACRAMARAYLLRDDLDTARTYAGCATIAHRRALNDAPQNGEQCTVIRHQYGMSLSFAAKLAVLKSQGLMERAQGTVGIAAQNLLAMAAVESAAGGSLSHMAADMLGRELSASSGAIGSAEIRT